MRTKHDRPPVSGMSPGLTGDANTITLTVHKTCPAGLLTGEQSTLHVGATSQLVIGRDGFTRGLRVRLGTIAAWSRVLGLDRRVVRLCIARNGIIPTEHLRKDGRLMLLYPENDVRRACAVRVLDRRLTATEQAHTVGS